MPQKNLVRFECTSCHRINYHSKKNKKLHKERLEMIKYCPSERKRTMHKETK